MSFVELGKLAQRADFIAIVKHNTSTFTSFFDSFFGAHSWETLKLNNYHFLHQVCSQTELKNWPICCCTCGALFFMRSTSKNKHNDNVRDRNRLDHFRDCDGKAKVTVVLPGSTTPGRAVLEAKPELEAAIAAGIVRAGISVHAGVSLLSELWSADPERNGYMLPFINNPYPKFSDHVTALEKKLINSLLESINGSSTTLSVITLSASSSSTAIAKSSRTNLLFWSTVCY
jgi:hypothetical protein